MESFLALLHKNVFATYSLLSEIQPVTKDRFRDEAGKTKPNQTKKFLKRDS
jgi:hypothetical protein